MTIAQSFNTKFPEAVVTTLLKSNGDKIVMVNGKSAFNMSDKGWWENYMVRMENTMNRG